MFFYNYFVRPVRRFLVWLEFVKPRIYIGCALTHAPEEFKREVELLKTSLRMDGYKLLEFLGLVAGTERDVYRWDIHHCVATCDFFVAICDHTSIGLGYELAVAVEKLKLPVLAVAHRDAKVTRMILGIESRRYEFKRYDTLDDVARMVRMWHPITQFDRAMRLAEGKK